MSDGTSMIRSEHGNTILDDQTELIIQVQRKLTELTSSEIVAMDIAARLERAIIDTMQLAKFKPREQQHYYSFAMNQFLVDPVPKE